MTETTAPVIQAVLRIRWIADMREMLGEMVDELRIAADSETNIDLSLRLESLRLEAYRLAQDYAALERRA